MVDATSLNGDKTYLLKKKGVGGGGGGGKLLSGWTGQVNHYRLVSLEPVIACYRKKSPAEQVKH